MLTTLTIFLARVFGLYLLVVGIAVFTNPKHIMGAVFAMPKERFAQLTAGIVAFLIGSFLINLQNDWSSLPASLLTVICWLIALKGAAYLLVPEAHMMKWVKMLSDRSWYMVDALVAVIAGVYLLAVGFGFM